MGKYAVYHTVTCLSENHLNPPCHASSFVTKTPFCINYKSLKQMGILRAPCAAKFLWRIRASIESCIDAEDAGKKTLRRGRNAGLHRERRVHAQVGMAARSRPSSDPSSQRHVRKEISRPSSDLSSRRNLREMWQMTAIICSLHRNPNDGNKGKAGAVVYSWQQPVNFRNSSKCTRAQKGRSGVQTAQNGQARDFRMINSAQTMDPTVRLKRFRHTCSWCREYLKSSWSADQGPRNRARARIAPRPT